MSMRNAIISGIGAHGKWKQCLLNAIATGKSEWTPDIVCQDNQCDFGKWLYSCSSNEQTSPHYNKIKGLHADFHKTAADVLTLALAGKTDDAKKAVDLGSEYVTISGSLTKEMMAWKADES